MAVHATAIVEDGARLADGVEIGPFCIVESGAQVEAGVRLLSHVVVRRGTVIGERTVVHPQTILGGEAQIRNASAPEATLIIGSDNVIREGVTMSAGSQKGGGITRVGDRNYFMAYSHVGHDCQVRDEVTLSNGVQLGGHVEVGTGVIMGGLAAAQQFARIGDYAFVSGLSGVSADIVPFGMALGLHARLGGLNLIGLKRRGVPRPNIHALRATFRTIFQEPGGTIQERAQEAARQWAGVPEVEQFTKFILEDSKRPIAPARIRADPLDEPA